jgi:type VII secretion protein EccB
MPSRQDQLHSYQFMIQRVVAALVMRETDPAQSPFRRAMGATLASVLIAAILLGGTAAWAVLRGSSAKNWKPRAESAVVVEKETGARYVLRNGVLHPVLNFSSGVLLAGSATVTVSAKALEGEPRGATFGIPDAPDSLPDRSRITGGPWTVCSTTGTKPVSALSIGPAPTGGADLGERAALVRGTAGDVWLLWNDRRHQVTDADLLKLLGGGTVAPVTVSEALLKPFEEGDRIAPVRPAGAGKDSAAVTGRRIGTVVTDGQDRHGVVVDDGVAPITPLQRAQLLNDPEYPALSGMAGELVISGPEFTGWARAPWTPRRAGAAPAELPQVADVGAGALCAVYDPGRKEPADRFQVWVGGAIPDATGNPVTAGRTENGGVLADHVLIRPGWGALVEAAPAPGATGGAVSLVTDPCRRYALADATDVKKRLGYESVEPVTVPAGFVTLIPAGAGLDPAAAERPVTTP